jgi:Cu(I)/Ag(I) efflux system membrane protein CusA/SilA
VASSSCAPGRTRSGDDRRSQGQARPSSRQPAGRRGNRADLRPLAPDRRAVRTSSTSWLEEFIVVALVCALFLFHLRSALVAIVSLPLGILDCLHRHALPGRQRQHHVAGRDRDRDRRDGRRRRGHDRERAQAHRGLEPRHPGRKLEGERHWQVIDRGSRRSRPGAVLFAADHRAVLHPGVHTRSAGRPAVRAAGVYQDLRDGGGGRPVSDADSGADGLPGSADAFPRRREPAQSLADPAYRPLLDVVLRRPKAPCSSRHYWPSSPLWPMSRLGGEFMPPLDEGDLLYMPSALPGIGAGKAAELLQQTDRLIKTVPEVATSSARPAAPKPPPIRRRWRCSKPPSSSSRASNGAPG